MSSSDEIDLKIRKTGCIFCPVGHQFKKRSYYLVRHKNRLYYNTRKDAQLRPIVIKEPFLNLDAIYLCSMHEHRNVRLLASLQKQNKEIVAIKSPRTFKKQVLKEIAPIRPKKRTIQELYRDDGKYVAFEASYIARLIDSIGNGCSKCHARMELIDVRDDDYEHDARIGYYMRCNNGHYFKFYSNEATIKFEEDEEEE